MKSLQDKYGSPRSERVIGPEPRLHEHSNHPDFKFVVVAKDYDEENSNIKELYDNTEFHALIYCNSSIAVTMYEYCFAMWYLQGGFTSGGGSLWRFHKYDPGVENRNWRLTKSSIENIKKYLEDSNVI